MFGMMRRGFGLCIVSVGVLLAAGCADDDPAEVVDPPPNLTGSYELESFSAVVTGGATLVPPAISGEMTLQQTAVNGSEATGSFEFIVTIHDTPAGPVEVQDSGTYTVRADGSWEQRGSILQGTGTVTLSGGTLTVEVTAPATSVSSSVWQRQ